MEETGLDALDYLFSLSRPNHIAIHDAYMVDQYPNYKKLKELTVFGSNGWYQCTLCTEKPVLTETLVGMMAHFEKYHSDLGITNVPSTIGGEDNSS